MKPDKRHILRYLNGRRKGRPANRVERAALQDPFLAEALAGYETHGGRPGRSIAELERRVKARPSVARNRWWEAMTGALPTAGGEWTELVFEGKNRAYGAYDLRRSSSKRHLQAYACVAAAVALVLLLSGVVRWLTPQSPRYEMLAVAELSDIKTAMPETFLIEEIAVPPPPPLRDALKFTVVRVDDDTAVADEEISIVEELVDDETLSVSDETSSSKEYLDISDLQEQKVIMKAAEEVFTVAAVEQAPEFPGGMGALLQWMSKELQYPVLAQEMGVSGRVVLQFTVGKDGRIRDVRVLRSVEPSLEREAVRVVSAMPPWIPGKQRGRAVAVRYELPVVFQIKN
jgi:protein TonB